MPVDGHVTVTTAREIEALVDRMRDVRQLVRVATVVGCLPERGDRSREHGALDAVEQVVVLGCCCVV